MPMRRRCWSISSPTSKSLVVISTTPSGSHYSSALFFYSYLTKVKTTTNGADEVEYRWGPRAQVEVKKEDLIEFIKEIYGDEADATFVRELKKQAGLAKPPGQATASQQPASQEASGSRR